MYWIQRNFMSWRQRTIRKKARTDQAAGCVWRTLHRYSFNDVNTLRYQAKLTTNGDMSFELRGLILSDAATVMRCGASGMNDLQLCADLNEGQERSFGQPLHKYGL
jgi:hypothetical protein